MSETEDGTFELSGFPSMDSGFVRAHKEPWLDGIRIGIVSVDHSRPGPHPRTRALVVEKVIVREVKPGAAMPGADALVLSDKQAQVLMDDLWNCGVRPTDGAGSAGAMAATQKHLEDMRVLTTKLVNNVLGVQNADV